MITKILSIALLAIMTVISASPVSADTTITKSGDGYYRTITVAPNGIFIRTCKDKKSDADLDFMDIHAKVDSIKKELREKILKSLNDFNFDIPGISIYKEDSEDYKEDKNNNDTAADDKADNNTDEENKNEETPKPAAYPEYVTKVIELTNAERTKYGLPALELSDALCSSAQAHADDMYANDYFSHTSQDGRTLRDRIEKYSSEYGWMGENIAKGYGTPEAVVEGWMNSEGHRANILSENYTDIGVGYSNGYWVQNFGG